MNNSEDNSLIHPTAILGDGVVLGKNVSVGAYATIDSGARIGDGCNILSHAVIKKYADLGDYVEVGHFAVIAGDPQHLSFDRSVDSRVIVGSRTRIGEGVSIHRSIEKTGETTVGDDCFLMGYAHIAHDCILAHRVTLANGVLLGGHVSVGKDVFLGGGAAVHQFVRIGQGAMVGGLAEVSMDIPSQALASGRNQVSGLNLIGLKRRNVSRENITELKHVFSQVMTLGNKREKAIEILQGEDCPTSDIAKEFLKFFGDGQRGFARLVNKHT